MLLLENFWILAQKFGFNFKQIKSFTLLIRFFKKY